MKYLLYILTLSMGWMITASATNSPEPAIEVSSDSKLASMQLPVEVTAEDFITKVYGVLDARLSKQQLLDSSRRAISLIPEEDEYGLWLETENGYSISYRGMQPDVAARAVYSDDAHISDYGFFFLFPYDGGERDKANSEQAEFTGTLLQEMMDMGIEMTQDTVSDALFEVTADYNQDLVDMRLVEEHNTDDNSGRFILILTVNPDNPDTYTAER